MDIEKLAISLEPMAMDLLHPISGEPITDEQKNKTRLFVRHSAHPEVKKIELEIQQRELDLIRKGRVMSVEEDEANAVRKTVAYLTGWENFFFEGKNIKFTEKKATEILEQPKFIWIRRQINSFVRDMANFILA